MSPFPCRVFLPPSAPPLGPSPLRSAPRGRPRPFALASAPSRPSTPRQARCLVFWLFGEGFFGGPLMRCIPSLRSGTGVSSSRVGFKDLPISYGEGFSGALLIPSLRSGPVFRARSDRRVQQCPHLLPISLGFSLSLAIGGKGWGSVGAGSAAPPIPLPGGGWRRGFSRAPSSAPGGRVRRTMQHAAACGTSTSRAEFPSLGRPWATQAG